MSGKMGSLHFVSHPPLRTVRDRFRVTRLCGGGLASVQPLHITCASPCKAVHLDCFALCVAFPRSLVRHHSHDSDQSSCPLGARPYVIPPFVTTVRPSN